LYGNAITQAASLFDAAGPSQITSLFAGRMPA
jgi:hypothetical protein